MQAPVEPPRARSPYQMRLRARQAEWNGVCAALALWTLLLRNVLERVRMFQHERLRCFIYLRPEPC